MIESTPEIQRSAKSVNEERYALNMTDTTTRNFWKRVNKEGAIPPHRPELGNCWVWTSSLSKSGYGQHCYPPSILHTHRLSWIMHFGVIPEGKWVLHKCDNPSCVRPDHLFLGTPQDNTDDMVSKNRQVQGEDVTQAKLTKDQVVEIRKRWSARLTQQKLADEYGVNVGTINMALYRTWKGVPAINKLK